MILYAGTACRPRLAQTPLSSSSVPKVGTVCCYAGATVAEVWRCACRGTGRCCSRGEAPAAAAEVTALLERRRGGHQTKAGFKRVVTDRALCRSLALTGSDARAGCGAWDSPHAHLAHLMGSVFRAMVRPCEFLHFCIHSGLAAGVRDLQCPAASCWELYDAPVPAPASCHWSLCCFAQLLARCCMPGPA